jgi:glucose 1-dehydrogenase
VVTGASQGIGLATAVALAEAGASVAFNYRERPHAAREAVEKIERAGGRAMLIQADVAEQSAVQRMVDETVAAFGRLDIAVTNAAYSDREPFHEADMAGFRRTIDVTMWGAFYLLRAATRQMIAQASSEGERGGSIVVVSSPHAFVAVPRSMAYNMAKAAIDQMARTAAIELVEHKIRVNVITPGWIDTPGERKFASEETIERAGAKLPWQRMGQPEEIGRGVVFLCDPASDYITGSSLSIDGGITLPWWAHRGSGVPE